MGQTIGKTSLTGTGAAFNLTSPKLLTGGIQQVVLAAGQRIIECGVGWSPTPTNGTATGSVKVCLYNLADNTPIPGTEITLNYDGAALQTANVATHVKQTGLTIDLSAHAGKTVAPGLAPPSQASNSGFKVIIETVTGCARNNHTTNQTTFPNPFSIATTTADSAWGVYFITEDISPSVTITSVNAGAGVRANSTGNTAVTTFVSTPTSGSLGAKAISITGFVAGTVAFSMPNYVDGASYPRPNGTHTFTLTDGTNSPTLPSVQLNPPTGRTAVTVASPDNVNQKKVGYWLAQAGRAPVNGDVLIGVDSQVTWLADTGGIANASLPLTTELIHWQQSSGNTYIHQVTITPSGDIVVPDSGIVSSKITVSGITSRTITESGI